MREEAISRAKRHSRHGEADCHQSQSTANSLAALPRRISRRLLRDDWAKVSSCRSRRAPLEAERSAWPADSVDTYRNPVTLPTGGNTRPACQPANARNPGYASMTCLMRCLPPSTAVIHLSSFPRRPCPARRRRCAIKVCTANELIHNLLVLKHISVCRRPLSSPASARTRPMSRSHARVCSSHHLTLIRLLTV